MQVAVHPEHKDRRRRYNIELPLRYKVDTGKRRGLQGTGKTCNMSSDGVLFEADQIFRRGELVKLSIEWPALLNSVHHMNLVLEGTVLRSDRGRTAVKVKSTEFRIRGRQ